MTKRRRISKRTTRKLHNAVLIGYIEAMDQKLHERRVLGTNLDSYLILTRAEFDAITKVWGYPYDHSDADQS